MISKTNLAIERHNLKNFLVKLKAQDDIVKKLQGRIKQLQNKNSENILEEIQQWIIRGLEIRVEKRKFVNEELDNLPKVNSISINHPNRKRVTNDYFSR